MLIIAEIGIHVSICVSCIHMCFMYPYVFQGGLGTRDEMCLTFAYYYPRMKMGQCLSQSHLEAFPVANYEV